MDWSALESNLPKRKQFVMQQRVFLRLILLTDQLCLRLSGILISPSGLDGASGSDTKCLSYVRVYGEKSKYGEGVLRDLESCFRQRMSEFLRLENASLVDVTVVGGGSITIFFLLPMEASLRLWEAWRNHPRSVQSAMRGLIDHPDYPNDPIPVITVGSAIGIPELRMINQHRSRVKKERLAADSGELTRIKIYISLKGEPGRTECWYLFANVF